MAGDFPKKEAPETSQPFKLQSLGDTAVEVQIPQSSVLVFAFFSPRPHPPIPKEQ
jgi:hypothetical protein